MTRTFMGLSKKKVTIWKGVSWVWHCPCGKSRLAFSHQNAVQRSMRHVANHH